MSIENPKVTDVFQPTPISVKFGEEEYTIKFDMMAFLQLEKVYGSVDVVLEMLFGSVGQILEPVVTYNDAEVLPSEIKVDGTPLDVIIMERSQANKRKAKHSDALELLWAGILNENAIYNDDDELIGYKVSKRHIAEQITFRNYGEVNRKVLEVILRDLAPNLGLGESKNATENQEEVQETQPVLHFPKETE